MQGASCGALLIPGCRTLQVIAFSDEEGVRFQSTFLGSAALAGILPVSALRVSDKRLLRSSNFMYYNILFLSVCLWIILSSVA